MKRIMESVSVVGVSTTISSYSSKKNLIISSSCSSSSSSCYSSCSFSCVTKKKFSGISLILKSSKLVTAVADSSISPATKGDLDMVMSQPSGQTKTVHVKFVLEKACEFGQQFFIVGDDPVLGQWDPVNGLPLEWSDGHLWTTEMDLPAGKSIQFKFVLRISSMKLEWQPDPDRALETWETENMIVISEDWENAKAQKITEEPLLTALTEDAVVESKTGISEEAKAKEAEQDTMDRNFTWITTDDEEKPPAYESTTTLAPGLSNHSSPLPFQEEDFKGNVVEVASATEDTKNNLQQEEQPEAPIENLNKDQAIAVEEELNQENPPNEVSDSSSTKSSLQNDCEGSKSQSGLDVARNDVHWSRKALQQILLNLGLF